MKDRISYIIQSKNISKTKFAQQLNLSQAFVSQLCSGASKPSERTISDICRVYGVNPGWLRDGVGEPFLPKSRVDELAEIFAHVQISDEPKAKLIKAMARMPDESFPAFLKFLEGLAKELSEEE